MTTNWAPNARRSETSTSDTEPSDYDRFEDLARGLVNVPKNEIKEAEARERDKRRTV